MQIPNYTGIFFSTKSSPNTYEWHACKEDAGRYLAQHNSAGVLLVCKTETYTEKHHGIFGTTWAVKHKSVKLSCAKLQKKMQEIAKAFHTRDVPQVSPVKSRTNVLRIDVPPRWRQNRITTHLLLTYVKRVIKPSAASDINHLQSAKRLIAYAKAQGLTIFNRQMSAILQERKNTYPYTSIRGIVEAGKYMDKHYEY